MSQQQRHPNKLSRTVALFGRLPDVWNQWALNAVLGRVVPMVGAAKVRFELLSAEKVVAELPNHRRVQNHIQGVHAAAMALLAETATGFVVGMNVPDDKLPLIKTLKVDYFRRAVGGLRAEATLTQAQIGQIRTQDKGEVTVAVRISDESGAEPIVCEMLWAWVPKTRK